MIRFLTNIPPPVHILLLILIPLLRLPGFDGNYLLEEESLYLMLAKSLSGDAQLYADAWFTGPPVMVWIYAFFYKIFGSSTLIAIRIFSCFYIYISAVYFNGILADYKLFRRNIGLSSVIFVFLVSVPWYAQQLSANLFVLLPIIFSFSSLLQLAENREKNYGIMFNVGFWMMVAILASYKVIFILLGLMFAYIFLKNARMDEFTALMGGMLSFLAAIMLYLYLSGTLSHWWDISMVSYLDRVIQKEVQAPSYLLSSVLNSWVVFWSILLVLSIVGFLHFRVRFYSYVTKIRSIEMIMAVWLIGIVMALGFKFYRLDLTDFILLVPPVVFYTSKTFDFKWVHKLRYVLLILLMFMPIRSYLSYLGIRYPQSLETFYPEDAERLLHGGIKGILERKQEIYGLHDEASKAKSIWIMEYNPELYVALNSSCGVRYTDYRIAYYKVPTLPGGNTRIFSRRETDRDVYEQFKKNLPDMVLDPNGNFPYLQKRYPQLLSNYSSRELGNYQIYENKASSGTTSASLTK